MIPLVIAIRTADRSPRRNYLGDTVRAFLAGQCDPALIHLFPTDPDTTWLHAELGDLPVCVHAPDHVRTANGNGVALITALDCLSAEWILLAEDDLEMVRDPIGSMTRWLVDHARPDVAIYRFFALPNTLLRRCGPHVAQFPLWEMRGSQAIAMRAADARAVAAWATAHPLDWRPKTAPFQSAPHKGFDKLCAYASLALWPKQKHGLISVPMMVNHVGRHSLLHTHGVSNDSQFAGREWAYTRAAV